MEVESGKKNAVIACEECRHRKRKCDGLTPTCSLCQKHNRQCFYNYERVSKKRKANEQERIQELEDQITALRAYVKSLEKNEAYEQQSSTLAEDLVTEELLESQDFAVVDGENTVPGRVDVVIEEERLPAAVDDLSNLLWSLQVDEAGDTSFQGPSGNFCFPHTKTAMRDTTHERPKSGYPESVGGIALPALHDGAMRKRLISLFIEHVNAYHCFIEPEDLGDSLPLLPLLFLRAAVVAAGSMYTSDPDLKDVGQADAIYAKGVAMECAREHPSLNVLRGLTILSWIELSLEHNHMGWMYNSMAASIVLEMGLHVETVVHPRSLTQEAQASRRKAFWAFFILDRMATSLLGRNCTLPWRRVHVPDVSTGYELSMTIEQSAFSLQCQLWSVHDQYMDQIYSFEFDDLLPAQKDKLLLDAREALLNYRSILMSQLPINPRIPDKRTCSLHMSYYMSLMLIHRPFTRKGIEVEIRRLALRSISTAADAFTRLIKLFRKMHSFIGMPFILVHHVLTAAISHLFNATSADLRLRRVSANGVRAAMGALEELTQTWPTRGSHAIRIVQELAARWSVVYALPIHLSYPLAHSETNASEGQEPLEPDVDSESNDFGPIDHGLNAMPGSGFDDVFGNNSAFLAFFDSTDEVFSTTAMDLPWDTE